MDLDPTPRVNDFVVSKKIFFRFFSYKLPAGHYLRLENLMFC